MRQSWHAPAKHEVPGRGRTRDMAGSGAAIAGALASASDPDADSPTAAVGLDRRRGDGGEPGVEATNAISPPAGGDNSTRVALR